MSRQARNKAVDGVVLFWESLSPADRVEAVKRMLDTIIPQESKAPAQPKKSPKKGGNAPSPQVQTAVLAGLGVSE